MNEGLDFTPGAAADDDPEVLKGMELLRILPTVEGVVVELLQPPA